MADKQRPLRGRAKRLANLDASHTDQDYDLKELDRARARRSIELLIPDKVPPEIRIQIAGYCCNPQFYYFHHHRDGLRVKWFPARLHKLPASIFREGIASWYASKKLIIELPEFTPGFVTGGEPSWPSAIHIHDETHELSFWCAPSFMTRDLTTSSSVRYLYLNDFEECPMWLFSSITIQIPPPGSDPASLIMNWSRLKYIGHALQSSLSRSTKKRHEEDFPHLRFFRNRLPHVRVQFLEQASRSWMNPRGELCTSLDTVGNFLDDGSDNEQLPDLVFLLRALAAVRGAHSISVDLPFHLPPSEQGRNFSVKWFENEQAQKYSFGEYMELGGWNDRKSFEWLQRCELVLHMTLNNLDSILAPYLRLEQMAYLSPLVIFRLFDHALGYGGHILAAACKQIKQILRCRYLHTLDAPCSCWYCSMIAKGSSITGYPTPQVLLHRWNIPGGQIPASEAWMIGKTIKDCWMQLKCHWEEEFQAVHTRLQIASNDGKIRTLDEIEGFPRPHVVDDISYSKADLFYNYTNTIWDWFWLGPDTHLRMMADKRPWLEAWPQGITTEISASLIERAGPCPLAQAALEF